jgi:alpha-methylacyl-CoA racemase
VAALFARTRSGLGAHIDQPLALAPLPFLTLARAESAAGGDGIVNGILAGRCPAYGVYTCADGARVALGALEPKFWIAVVEAAGLTDVVSAGLDTCERGRDAARRLAARFAEEPSAYWLNLAAAKGLPLTPVRTVEEALRDPDYARPAEPAGAAAPGVTRAPILGEHTEAVLLECGFTAEEVDDLRSAL